MNEPVYRMCRPKKRGVEIDLEYAYQFPKLSCDGCTPTRGILNFYAQEYPALDGTFLNSNEFTSDRIISLNAFKVLVSQLGTGTGVPSMPLPGASLATPTGVAPSKQLEDFVWGGVCLPQVSKRAVELLAAEGIPLTTGQIELRYRGQKVESHVSVQFDTIPILDDACLKRFDIIRCEVCKYWRKVQQRGYPLTGYWVRKDLWPNGRHLVQPLEGGREMVSPEFIEAVRKHGLTGIEFVECGDFV